MLNTYIHTPTAHYIVYLFYFVIMNTMLSSLYANETCSLIFQLGLFYVKLLQIWLPPPHRMNTTNVCVSPNTIIQNKTPLITPSTHWIERERLSFVYDLPTRKYLLLQKRTAHLRTQQSKRTTMRCAEMKRFFILYIFLYVTRELTHTHKHKTMHFWFYNFIEMYEFFMNKKVLI